MKNKVYLIIAIVAVLALGLILFGGCEEHTTGNRVTYGKDVQTFNYAYVYLDGKEIKSGYVTQWRDYDESDVVQVLIDGCYYLTHYSNVVLIADPSIGSVGYDSGVINYN